MKRTKVLALVLILAFALLGGAYAATKSYLYINTTVNTSTVDVTWELDSVPSSDPSPNYTAYSVVADGSGTNQAVYEQFPADKQPWDNIKRLDGLDSGNKNEAKNIGTLDVVSPGSDESYDKKLPSYEYGGKIYTGGDINDPRSSGDLLTITLKNGYPGYQEYITAKIKNVGKIPVKIDQSAFVQGGTDKWPEWLQVRIVNGSNSSIVYYDSANTATIQPMTGTQDQLKPGETIQVKIITRILDVDKDTNSTQLQTYPFTLQLRAIEWNEYNFPLPDEITQPD